MNFDTRSKLKQALNDYALKTKIDGCYFLFAFNLNKLAVRGQLSNLKNIKNFLLILIVSVLLSACEDNEVEKVEEVSDQVSSNVNKENENLSTPKLPNLQSEIFDEKNKTTDSLIGKFDFKNYVYPLPRGWHDVDGKEATLLNGARRMSEDRIGLSYAATKFGDVTGDGEDEAFVILKIETAGSAIPQIVYIYTLKNEEPELIWYFRTGDRAAGGLKDLRAAGGEVVVELFGQDRYILGELETSKITGDEQQLCCPTFFTRTRYKWNGKNFQMQGKRETFSIEDKFAPPVNNMNEEKVKSKK